MITAFLARDAQRDAPGLVTQHKGERSPSQLFTTMGKSQARIKTPVLRGSALPGGSILGMGIQQGHKEQDGDTLSSP